MRVKGWTKRPSEFPNKSLLTATYRRRKWPKPPQQPPSYLPLLQYHRNNHLSTTTLHLLHPPHPSSPPHIVAIVKSNPNATSSLHHPLTHKPFRHRLVDLSSFNLTTLTTSVHSTSPFNKLLIFPPKSPNPNSNLKNYDECSLLGLFNGGELWACPPCNVASNSEAWVKLSRSGGVDVDYKFDDIAVLKSKVYCVDKDCRTYVCNFSSFESCGRISVGKTVIDRPDVPDFGRFGWRKRLVVDGVNLYLVVRTEDGFFKVFYMEGGDWVENEGFEGGDRVLFIGREYYFFMETVGEFPGEMYKDCIVFTEGAFPVYGKQGWLYDCEDDIGIFYLCDGTFDRDDEDGEYPRIDWLPPDWIFNSRSDPEEGDQKEEMRSSINIESDSNSQDQDDGKMQCDSNSREKENEDGKIQCDLDSREKEDEDGKMQCDLNRREMENEDGKMQCDLDSREKENEDGKMQCDLDRREKENEDGKMQCDLNRREMENEDGKMQCDLDSREKENEDGKMQCDLDSREKENEDGKMQCDLDCREKENEDGKMQCDSDSREMENEEMHIDDANIERVALLQEDDASPSLFGSESESEAETIHTLTASLSVVEEVTKALRSLNGESDASEQGISRTSIPLSIPRACTSTTKSYASDSPTTNFEGFDIRSNLVPTLQKLWQKHGNIIENSTIRSGDMVSRGLEALATVVRILEDNSIESLSESQADYLKSTTSDLSSIRFKVDWLVPFVEKAVKLHKRKPLLVSLNNLNQLSSQVKERRAIISDELAKLGEEENRVMEEIAKVSNMIPFSGKVKFDEPLGLGLT